MRKMLAMVGILVFLLVGGVSPTVHQGSFPQDLTQLPAPPVPFGGDSSGS